MKNIDLVNYPEDSHWKNWMKSYKFGTLVFIPNGEVYKNTNLLRQKFDPTSAKCSMPHMTLTQPFLAAPGLKDIEKIQKVIKDFHSFKIKTGPVTTSANKKLIWIDVNPKEPFVELRNTLHDLNLFRTDLPFTKGFTPHMTISKFGDTSENINKVVSSLNSSFNVSSESRLQVKWIIPSDEFVFSEQYSFSFD